VGLKQQMEEYTWTSLITCILSHEVLMYAKDHHLYPHSFPTRRSSDLAFSLSRRAPGVRGLGGRERDARARREDLEWRPARHSDRDRKSTRLNSSHLKTSYAVFCLKKQRSAARILGTICNDISRRRTRP